MKIDHLAFWVDDLEKMKEFYLTYFDCTANNKYTNVRKEYGSYFISFDGSDCRIELMNKPGITPVEGQRGLHTGIAHLAINVGSTTAVDVLTEQFRSDGFTIYSEPRTTGDGYYESVVLDPEGNYLEITA